MAKKEELLDALDAHAKALQTGLDEIGHSITANNREIEELQRSRQTAIDAYAALLLPNLTEAAFAALAIPGVPTYDHTTQLLDSRTVSERAQLARLLPSLQLAVRTEFETHLRAAVTSASAASRTADGVLERLTSIPELTRLFADGYGTPTYDRRWWQAAYYADWKAADEAVTAARVHDWRTLSMHYWKARSTAEECQRDKMEVEAQLASLMAQFDEEKRLRTTIDAIHDEILALARAQIKARIDAMETLPEALRHLDQIPRKIDALRVANATHQDMRLRLSAQLTEVRKVREQAMRSNATTVPDAHVRTLRAATSPVASTMLSSSGQTAQSQTDDGFNLLQTVLLIQMMDHFSHSDGNDHGHGHDNGMPSVPDATPDTFYDDVRNDALNDTSGQS